MSKRQRVLMQNRGCSKSLEKSENDYLRMHKQCFNKISEVFPIQLYKGALITCLEPPVNRPFCSPTQIYDFQPYVNLTVLIFCISQIMILIVITKIIVIIIAKINRVILKKLKINLGLSTCDLTIVL